MENIILSLLLLKSMTIYEMRMFIQKNLNTVCSDSLGSIQISIKKLLNKGSISIYEYTENSMIKKEYRIMKKGLAQFTEWIEKPMNLQKVKNMEEGKFFFLGMAPKEIRIISIESYLNSLNFELEKLLQIQVHIKSIKKNIIQMNTERISRDAELSQHLLTISQETSLEAVIQNIYDYQMYNLQYGLKRLQDDILFYQEILDREHNKSVR